MAISVNAAVSAYIPQQAHSPQAGADVVQAAASVQARGQSTDRPVSAPPQQTGAHANPRPRSQADPNNTTATREQRAQNARKKNPAAQVTARPGYTFTVDLHNHRIMKVNDSKGVLIYQIPSKGQLALITAQEDKRKQLRLTA